MKQEYIKNALLVLCREEAEPLAFRNAGERMLLDTVMDACRKTKSVDTVVLLSDEAQKEFLKKRYGVPVLTGKISDALSYFDSAFACKKIVLTKGNCPFASSEEYDRLFGLLEQWDGAFAADGGKAVFPLAFRFETLLSAFSETEPLPELLPAEKRVLCEEFSYQKELSAEEDLTFFEKTYEEAIVKPQNERTLGIVNYYLSADGTEGIADWIGSVQKTIKELAEKYELTSYSINSQTEGNVVYEATSKKYGDIIIKFTPSPWRFHKEWVYYHYADEGIMAPMLDYDTEKNMMVLKMIKPGFQVKFDPKNEELRRFFDFADAHRIPEERIRDEMPVPTIMGEFDDYAKAALPSHFEEKFRLSMEKKARLIWETYFEHAPKFYLHRDLHKRNILQWENGVVAIDPMGVLGPWEFEFVIPFVIELREYPDALNKKLYRTMMDYFTKYVDEKRLSAALFIFWVFKMNDYCFQKNDGFKLAGWCKKVLETVYFDGIEDPSAEDVLPQGLSEVENWKR